MARKQRTDVESLLTARDAKTYAETIDGQLQRIEDNAKIISAEASYLGLGDDKNLKESATVIAGILSRGTVTEEVKEGETYTIQAGYYEGGTIAGIAGGGNYSTQAKSVTPTTTQQVVTPDEGKYALSQVTVAAIPSQYKDTTGTNATASTVLTGYSAMTADGKVEGSMVDNAAVSVTLNKVTSSYTVPVGYHNGAGKVTVASSTATATPTESQQTIVADGNKFLTSVTVEAIDKDTYLTNWTNTATAAAGDIFVGKTAYVNGSLVEGTMVDNSAWDKASHVLTTEGTTGDHAINIPEGYHDGNGTVKITGQDKTATAPAPGVAQQVIKADDGYVLNQVTVPALDAKYQDVSGVTATAAHVCVGQKFVNASGTLVDGTLADGGDLANTTCQTNILASGSDGCTFLTGTEAHYSSVTASMDGSLYTRLAAI